MGAFERSKWLCEEMIYLELFLCFALEGWLLMCVVEMTSLGGSFSGGAHILTIICRTEALLSVCLHTHAEVGSVTKAFWVYFLKLNLICASGRRVVVLLEDQTLNLCVTSEMLIGGKKTGFVEHEEG